MEKLNEWIVVESYKDLPLNVPVIVKIKNDLDKEGFTLQIAINDNNCPMIGHYFAWDCNKVLAYKYIS